MQTILCYGDSNTWGYNPVNKSRHCFEDRWTTVMQQALGKEYLVISEGLNGRTTVWDDPIELHKNGSQYLPPCLASHQPIDLVILMLGTNDLKARFRLSATDIAAGVGVLLDIVQTSICGPGNTAPDVLVLIPPKVRKLTEFAQTFAGARETSRHFPEAYANMCKKRNVPFLDLNDFVRFSNVDGLHFESEQLAVLGNFIAGNVWKFGTHTEKNNIPQKHPWV